MLEQVSSPSTELAGFRTVIVFTTPRHFVRSHASSFTSPFFFISFSTCFFHVCFGLPLSQLPLTSKPSLSHFHFFPQNMTVPPHTTCFSILSKDSFMSINSSLFLRSSSFTPHIAWIIALSVLLKIAISFFLKYHASLPYNIADCTQLL